MSVNTYDPLDVNVVINGTILTGFADGTFIKVEANEDSYTTHVGAKGEVSRSRNANKTGKVIVTLAQDSPSNAYLNKLEKGTATYPVSVVDQNFDETAGGNDCWILKRPGAEYGKDLANREWTFVVPKLAID